MAAETLPIVDLRGLAATAENADAFGANAAFHSRPLPEQQAVAINSAHRGYMGMATSLIVTSSVEEATKPNLSESFILMHEVLPGEERGPLDGPNQWPAAPDGFQETITAYDAALRRLGQHMTRRIAVALQMEPRGLDEHFRRPTTFLRLLHYPSSPPDADDRQYAWAPHTDYDLITILAQDHTGGLQVRSRDHDWIRRFDHPTRQTSPGGRVAAIHPRTPAARAGRPAHCCGAKSD